MLGSEAMPTPLCLAVASIFVNLHGGWAGTQLDDLLPGNRASLGSMIGAEGGIRLLGFEVSADASAYSRGGRVDRASLALRPTLHLLGAALYLRAGAGLVRTTESALTAKDAPGNQEGVFARLGAGVEAPIASYLFVGFGLDAEYYAITSGGLNGAKAGYDVMGNFKLGFELGF